MKKFPISPDLQRLLDAIIGGGGVPIVVGGAVRDFLFDGREPKDVDVEVFGLEVERLEEVLRDRFKVDAVGKSFGVLKVTASEGAEPFDVSLPRRESKEGGGHKGFIASPDPNMTYEEAASRRDFTINSIGYNPVTGEFLDPHNGIQDLKDRVLRATSDHFSEDPLRVMRACQFAARFGMSIDDRTIDMCWALNSELPSLPGERLWEEWKKLLLKAEKPSIGIQALKATGALTLFPELSMLQGVEQDPEWHPEGWSLTPVTRLAPKSGAASVAEAVAVDRGTFALRELLSGSFTDLAGGPGVGGAAVAAPVEADTSAEVQTAVDAGGLGTTTTVVPSPAGLAEAQSFVLFGPSTPPADEGVRVVLEVPFTSMERVVRSSQNDFEIFEAVVGPITVLVMDMLMGGEAPAQMKLHYDPVDAKGPVMTGPTGVEVPVSVIADTRGTSVDGDVRFSIDFFVGHLDLSHTPPPLFTVKCNVGDVWIHNNMVVDCAAEIIRRPEFDLAADPTVAQRAIPLIERDPDEALLVMLGALCHDFGKPATTKFIDGRWRARCHEEEGEIPTRTFLRRLKAPQKVEEAVVAVVVDHLKPSMFFKQKPKAGAIRRLALRLSEKGASIPLLCRVAEADSNGRTTERVLKGLPYEAGPWLLERAANVGVQKKGPEKILKGRHLMELGYQPGPELGKMVKAGFEAQLDGAFEDEAGAKAWAKEQFGKER